MRLPGKVVVTSAKTYKLTYTLSSGTYWDGTLPDPWQLVFADPTDCVTNDASASVGVLPASCFADGTFDPAKTA